MGRNSKQNILCSVSSCKYNQNAKECSLRSILVTSDAAAPRVDSAEQSMCSSFEHE